jgi:hypothetical protein
MTKEHDDFIQALDRLSRQHNLRYINAGDINKLLEYENKTCTSTLFLQAIGVVHCKHECYEFYFKLNSYGSDYLSQRDSIPKFIVYDEDKQKIIGVSADRYGEHNSDEYVMFRNEL